LTQTSASISSKKKPIVVFEKFKNFTVGDIGISSITLAELQYGIEKSSIQSIA